MNHQNRKRALDPNFTIYVVDDVAVSRHILKAALAPSYAVETFETAEACITRMEEQMPQLFLLDVGLPGMNGFELCEHIRGLHEGEHTPVVFISALDDIDSRLEGYRVGGTDFVVKPYKLDEIRQKVEVARKFVSAAAQLHQQVQETSSMSMSFLNTLGESAELLNFLRELNQCNTYSCVGHGVLKMLAAFNLNGVVQIRANGNTYTYSPEMQEVPLEASVIATIQNMGRIVSFRSHSAYNFDSATLYVSNMPIHDEDACGRFRDHLMIAAESIDAKVRSLELAERYQQLERAQTDAFKHRTRSGIHKVINDLRGALDSFKSRYAAARQQGTSVGIHLQSDLLGAFAYLGLSSDQESSILTLIQDKTDYLVGLYDFSAETESTLQALSEQLITMLDHQETTPARRAMSA